VPPVAADSSAGDVGDIFPENGFVDVGMALEDAEDVVAFEEVEHLVGVGYAESVVRRWDGRLGDVGEEGRDEWDVDGDDDGGSCGEGREVGGEPLELCGVDAAFVGAVGGDADGVEDDEVVALVVEGVVELAEALLEEGFAVEGVGGVGATGGVDAKDIVVADGVVDLEAEVLLGLAIEIEELQGALLRDAEGVEDVVAAVDGEVGLDGAGLFEGHVGADDAVEFGLEVGVSDEEEGEGLLCRVGRGEERGRDGRCDASGSEESDELAAASVHADILCLCREARANVRHTRRGNVEFSDEISDCVVGGGGDCGFDDGSAGSLYGSGAGSALRGDGAI